MSPQKKARIFEIGLFLAVFIFLVVVWAINGYDDTWLYVTAGIIAIPSSWFLLGRKDKDKK